MMNKKSRKIVYFILVLVIFIVIAIIGGLATVLFNMTEPKPVKTTAAAPELKTNVVTRITPVAKTYIEIPSVTVEPVHEARPKTGKSVVPAICEGYGSQIKQRDAYKNPITYQAQVQPNHVQFTLYSNEKLNAKGSN